MGGLRTISIIVAANIKGLEKSMGKANKTVATFASKAARVGSMLTFGLTAPIVAMGKAAMDTFVNFEQSMAKVQAVTGATVEEFAMLTDEAKRLGATTVFTAQQFSDLQMVLGRKGFRPDAIKDMTGAISDLALATGEDLTLAAETVSSSINAFGLEASQAGSVANTLASAAANSSLSLSTFSTAFGHAGASAKAVGVDIEELSAMMGVLMDNGIKASKSGTGLRKIFGKLNEQGIPFSQTLDHLASGQMTLNQAQKLVGVTAANQLIILAKNKDKLSELTHEYKTNTGRLKEMADIMGNTTFAKLKKFTSAMEGLRLEFGNVIAEALMPIIEFLTKLAGAFGRLNYWIKLIIVVFSGILAVIGPLLLLLGSMSALVPIITAGWLILKGAVIAFGKALFVSLIPIIKFIALAAVLGSVFLYLVDNWKAMRERISDTGWWKNMLLDMLALLVEFNPISQLIKMANLGAKELGMSGFTNPFETLADTFTELKNPTKEYEHQFTGFVDGVVGGFKKVKKVIQPALDAMGNFFSFDSGGGKVKATPLLMAQEKSPFDFSEEYEKYLADLERAKAATLRWTNAINTFAQNSAITFAQSFADIIMSGEGLLKGLGDIFTQILKQLAAMVIKAAVLAAIFSLFPGMEGMGAAGEKGFVGIFQGMLGGKFADGGRPPLNRMSLVGENGPELFNPGSQSGTIIPNHAMGGGSSIPDVRISGNDLLIVFNKAQRRKNLR